MFQCRGVVRQILRQEMNRREQQRVVCRSCRQKIFFECGLTRRHDHLTGELAAPVALGDARRIPVQLHESPHLLHRFAAVVDGERLPGRAAGMPGNQRPPRNCVRDEIFGLFADLILGGEPAEAVFPVMRHMRRQQIAAGGLISKDCSSCSCSAGKCSVRLSSSKYPWNTPAITLVVISGALRGRAGML